MTHQLVRCSIAAVALSTFGVAPALAGGAANGGFVPIEPCRVLDTRAATALVLDGVSTSTGGAKIPAGSTLSISVNDDDFSSQGGGAAPCGNLSELAWYEINEVQNAIAYNVTVTQPSAGGYLTLWAYSESRTGSSPKVRTDLLPPRSTSELTRQSGTAARRRLARTLRGPWS